MAVVVPILIMATGAGAAAAAALSVSVGMLAVGASLALAATGIGAKINSAASNVFGKDLVNFANIAGGIALASGWNPADTLGSMTGATAGASGSASAAGGMAGAEATTAGALPAASNAAPGTFEAADQAMAADAGNASSYNASPGNNPSAYTPPGDGAPAAASATPASAGKNPSAYTPPGGATPPAGGDGIDLMRKSEIAYANSPDAAGVKTSQTPASSDRLGALKAWYDAQPERVKAAMVTAGGQAFAGAAGGYARNQELSRAEAERRRREDRFNTGSGTAFTYTAPNTARTGK